MDRKAERARRLDALLRREMAKGSSIKELADEIGIAANTLSSYRRGTREITEKTAAPIARFFGVPLPFLLAYEVPEQESDSPEGWETVSLTQRDYIAHQILVRLESADLGLAEGVLRTAALAVEDTEFRAWLRKLVEMVSVTYGSNGESVLARASGERE